MKPAFINLRTYLIVLPPQTLPELFVNLHLHLPHPAPLQLLDVAAEVGDGQELCGVPDVGGGAEGGVDVARVGELDDLGERLGRQDARVARQDRLQALPHAPVRGKALALQRSVPCLGPTKR